MATTPERDILEETLLVRQIRETLAREHNWESQERQWYWQRWVWAGTFLLAIVALLLNAFAGGGS